MITTNNRARLMRLKVQWPVVKKITMKLQRFIIVGISFAVIQLISDCIPNKLRKHVNYVKLT